MKIMLVRHAEPDYTIDSLTAKGRVEAELLSQKLTQLDVKDFYVSPLGRARDTAEHTLSKLGRTAEVLPWLAEFRGRYYDPDAGRERIPWDQRPRTWSPRPAFQSVDTWADDPLFEGGTVKAVWEETKAGVDELLARYGYRKDGRIFLCDNNTKDTIVLFCHFGIAMAVMGYLLDISPIILWHTFCMQPSSVTTLITEERVKGEVVFRTMQLGDLSHLYASNEPYSTAALYPEVYTGIDSTDPPEWGGRRGAAPAPRQ